MSLGTWSWQHNALFRIQGCGGDNTCDGVDDETMASLPRSNNASSCHVLCAQVLATLLGIQTKTKIVYSALVGGGLGMKWVSSGLTARESCAAGGHIPTSLSRHPCTEARRS